MDRVQLVRERVSRRFAQRLESEDLGKKLEVVLWNHTLRCCQRDKLPLEWSNDMNVNTFRERYTQKALAIDVHNLKTNDDLRKKIQTGELGLKKFIGMEPWEMNPDMWTPIFDRVAFKALRRQLTVDAENAPDGAFTCAKCNSKKTTYYQLQTRSADVKYAFLIQIQIVSHHFSFVCRADDGLYPMSQLFQTLEAITIKVKKNCVLHMCFSERVSWTTFGISMLGVLAALRNGDPHTNVLAYSLAVIGSMQAFEALLWRDPSNVTIARAACIVNHVQPLVFWALSSTFITTPRSPEAALRAQLAIAAYLAVAIPYTYSQVQKSTLVTVGPNGLEWEWNKRGPVVYALFLTSLCATADAYFDSTVVAVIVVSFGLSFAQYHKQKMVGSMWCFYAAFLPWLLVLR